MVQLQIARVLWLDGEINITNILKTLSKNIGKENFSFEVLWVCDPRDCLYFEQLYLDYYEPWVENGKGYNLCKIAGSNRGLKQTKETKEKIRKANIGRKHSEEIKEKARKTHTGKKHSEETKEKMKKAHTGKFHSEETKERMSEKQSRAKIIRFLVNVVLKKQKKK